MTALVERDTHGMARSPLAFEIEGELWGYPLSEQLYLQDGARPRGRRRHVVEPVPRAR